MVLKTNEKEQIKHRQETDIVKLTKAKSQNHRM